MDESRAMTKVLVVDDQPSVVALVRYHFESADLLTAYASDVEEGWRILVSERPDAAVIDVALPGAADGWALIEKIRADGRFHSLPVVVLTALHEPEIAERAKDLGCEFLDKPFVASALLNKIRGLLGANGHGGERPAAAASDGSRHVDLVAV